jgi:hypothetical protein
MTAITYAWRGKLGNDEINRLHAEVGAGLIEL